LALLPQQHPCQESSSISSIGSVDSLMANACLALSIYVTIIPIHLSNVGNVCNVGNSQMTPKFCWNKTTTNLQTYLLIICLQVIIILLCTHQRQVVCRSCKSYKGLHSKKLPTWSIFLRFKGCHQTLLAMMLRSKIPLEAVEEKFIRKKSFRTKNNKHHTSNFRLWLIYYMQVSTLHTF
jgi:hypothetical protein